MDNQQEKEGERFPPLFTFTRKQEDSLINLKLVRKDSKKDPKLLPLKTGMSKKDSKLERSLKGLGGKKLKIKR